MGKCSAVCGAAGGWGCRTGSWPPNWLHGNAMMVNFSGPYLAWEAAASQITRAVRVDLKRRKNERNLWQYAFTRGYSTSAFTPTAFTWSSCRPG